jgi:hypothetical protein
MSQQSLADLAVETLARVQQMGDGIGLEHPERHAIREMKQTAEQVLADAFRVAQRIAWASGTVREVVAEVAVTAQKAASQEAADGGKHG